MNPSLPLQMRPGRPEPLGSLMRDGGVNFAVFSEHATAVHVCVFDASGTRELRRYPLHGPQHGLWHGFLPGVGAGLVYGLRAEGPHQPEAGHLFNPHKLLLDPWAREIVGRFAWRAEHHGHELGHPLGPRSLDRRDNALHALKARVTAPPQPAPGWFNAPRHDEADVVLYEVHVKSFSQQHPDIPPDMRGTYAGLAHPAAIAHFRQLGVTTLSLLPVHYHLDEAFLVERGLVNHWGYNTLGFFCPDPRLSMTRDDPTAVNEEFRQMVATLHAHGLEVVLDVVYNHTAEGNEHGPTLSFRGLDHRSWYRLQPGDESRCENLTGCGNTLRVAHPRVMQFVLDSLRCWVHEMGVDGFRFDLAATLGRAAHGAFDAQAAFFTAVQQDPLLARARLIAEAWDSGPDGYQVGRFPGRWQEWNDKFRDSVRRYWLHPAQQAAVAQAAWGTGAHGRAGEPLDGPRQEPHAAGPRAPRGASRGEFARRFSGSNDLFHHGHRPPTASVNFISAHDGFTLADLTSHSRKHNLANGEDNRDGRDDEVCAPLGPEGPSPDASVAALRGRVRRALLCSLLLAQGTPMLLAGDEIGHSQGGNNNAWNQDNPTSWLHWASADADLLACVRDALTLRRREPALRHDRWFHGTPAPGGERSLVWTTPAGHDMHHHDWHDGHQGAFACRIDTAPEDDRPGSRHLLIAFNPEAHVTDFSLPRIGNPPTAWELLLDSSGELDAGLRASGRLQAPAHALLVLRLP